MKSRLLFLSQLVGITAASLLLLGGLVLLRTTAWDVAEAQTKIFTGLLLGVSAISIASSFVHLIREGPIDGLAAGISLIALGGYPLASSFHYLFIGPGYGGLIGGVGAAIALGIFLISSTATFAGLHISYLSFMWTRVNESEKSNKPSET